MKYLLITILTIIPFALNGQELKENENGSYEYQEVIEVEGANASEIFQKSKEWIAINYRNSNDVIELADSSQKLIIGSGYFEISMFFKKGEIRHTLKIEAREGRFRATYNQFSYYSSGSGEIPFEKKMASKKKIIDKTENMIKESLNSLKKSILSEEDEDW